MECPQPGGRAGDVQQDLRPPIRADTDGPHHHCGRRLPPRLGGGSYGVLPSPARFTSRPQCGIESRVKAVSGKLSIEASFRIRSRVIHGGGNLSYSHGPRLKLRETPSVHTIPGFEFPKSTVASSYMRPCLWGIRVLGSRVTLLGIPSCEGTRTIPVKEFYVHVLKPVSAC